jgi:RNA polymerase sigma factor (TIGR02999 family)
MDEREGLTLLLNRMFQGDGQAGEEALAVLYPLLRQAAGRRLGREGPERPLESRDLVNEAMARLLKSRITVRNRQHFFALVCLVMKHILIDEGRRHHPAFAALDESIAAIERSDHVQVHDIEQILERFRVLDPKASQVLHLRVGAGMTAREVATEMGCSAPTVNRYFDRARAWLYKEMRPLLEE